MRSRTPSAIAILLALIVLACGGGSSTPDPSGLLLEGRTFLSTGIDGRSLVAGPVVRISFQDGRVSASAGCNTMSGPYHIDGNVLVAGQLATTEMGCEPQLMAQDTWVGDLLDGATIALDGNTLTLTKAGVRVTLADRAVADPDRPLTGTPWLIDGMVNGGTASSIPAGITAAITLTDTHVDVEAGCNRGAGTVIITDTTIEFGPIALTKVACDPSVMAVEQAVTRTLAATVTYRIQADTLMIQAGEIGLMLRAAP